MMFSDKVWAMIHNRFKDSTRVIPWNENMDAADWWIANDMGDPYAEDVNIIAAKPMPDGMMGFFERLHHAYNSTEDFWNNKDEREWYETWILPFDNPIKHNRDVDWGGLTLVIPWITSETSETTSRTRLLPIYSNTKTLIGWRKHLHGVR